MLGKLFLGVFCVIVTGTFLGIDFYLTTKKSGGEIPDFRAYAELRTGGYSEMLYRPRAGGPLAGSVEAEAARVPSKVARDSAAGIAGQDCRIRAGVKVCSTAQPDAAKP